MDVQKVARLWKELEQEYIAEAKKRESDSVVINKIMADHAVKGSYLDNQLGSRGRRTKRDPNECLGMKEYKSQYTLHKDTWIGRAWDRAQYASYQAELWERVLVEGNLAPEEGTSIAKELDR